MTARWVPVALDLSGRRVVCVGGGTVAASKLEALDGAGAQMELVSPDAVPALAEKARNGTLTWHRRTYAVGDLEDAALAIAGTADPEVNERVAADAAAKGIACVRVDAAAGSPHPGSAALPAAVRRGPLTLAVTTSGAAPSLATRIRSELDQTYDEAYGTLAALMGELRADPKIARTLATLAPEERRARWRAVLEADTLRLIRGGEETTAKEVATACLCSPSG